MIKAADELNLVTHAHALELMQGSNVTNQVQVKVFQFYRVVEYASSSFNWRHYTGASYLDIVISFDMVWYEGLVW